MNKSELQETMGKNLYQARLNAHMTQEQLAEKAGISTSFYTNIELGHKGMGVYNMYRLINVLRVSADSIIYGNDCDAHILNILAILKYQPDSFLASVENMIRFMLAEKERQEKEQREEVLQ